MLLLRANTGQRCFCMCFNQSLWYKYVVPMHIIKLILLSRYKIAPEVLVNVLICHVHHTLEIANYSAREQP